MTNMDQRDSAGRPSVLDRATETQIEELERQFSEQDRTYWDRLTTSYGWTPDESQEVWAWFNNRPGQGTPGQSVTGEVQ